MLSFKKHAPPRSPPAASSAPRPQSSILATSSKDSKELSVADVLNKGLKTAFRGGLAGGVAMVINVCTLMWMRTTVNYQYRYGTGTFTSLRTLYAEGGVPRFYRGLGFALIQGPWSRFGDTFANTGALAVMDSMESTKDLAIGVKTVAASFSASMFRVISTPIDTCKTIMQVEGKEGLSKLGTKFKTAGGFPMGLPVFWYGALGSATATFVGHYPWFATYNYLQQAIPQQDELLKKLGRNAIIGFCASGVSDTCSNSLRVLKTYRQTSEVQISYPAAARAIIEKDGWGGLMGRGLGTKIVSNGMQGALFSVLWKTIEKEFQALF